MPAPWGAGAQARIKGHVHGQQTLNVLHFATNEEILDAGALDTILLELTAALVECVIENLLPAVTNDWTFTGADAKRIFPALSDPVESNAAPGVVGTGGVGYVSFASTLVALRTGIDGRKGRGRMFLPPPPEPDVATSAVDSSFTDAVVLLLTCMAEKFMGTSPTTPWRWGILSRKDLSAVGGTFNTAFRQIVSTSVRPNVSCIRSRKVGQGS